MAELAHFQNFAKLKDTSIEFNDITVLAGKPGTGKSYVMKMMYAIHKALDLIKSEYIELTGQMNKQMLEYLKLVEEYKSQPASNLLDAEKILLKLDEFDKKSIHLHNYINDGKFDKKIEKLRKRFLQNLLESMFGDIEQISSSFKIKLGYSSIVYSNSNLKKFTFHAKSIDGKDTFMLYEDFSMYENKFQQEPIFVETPLILEFKSFITREKGKTPYHIESLLNILDKDYSFTDEEQDKLIKSFREKSQSIIGGDIESSGDSFIFNRKNDKNYDILNASSGIKSIGLLQYLVTNKALKKGSILFWEEPEVHLHPEWQLRMVELFVELMNAGVKIVFSTHSPYMADYLNAISQKNEFRDRISFNLLKESDGVVENIILNKESWNEIQTELLDPLEEIVWEYL